MTVVPTSDSDEDGVIWLRCPQCQGFLPKFNAGLSETRAPADDEAASPPPDPAASPQSAPDADGVPPVASGLAPEDAAPSSEHARSDTPLDIDPATAVPYRPWGSYDVGAVVHHLAWDDYGVVIAKETLPGKRQVVRVRFERAGEVQLIEESDEGL